MTTARVGLDEYCKKHQIEDHLTEAVNACYAAQSEHPLASLAHHFVGKGLTHRLHSVAAAPVHCAAASGDWGAGLQIDISVNGRAVGGAATGLLPPDEFGGGGQLEAAARRIAAELSEKLAGAEVSVAGHVSDFDPACEGSESLRHHPAVQAAASLASVQAISRLRGRQDADTVSSIRLALSHPLNTTHHLDIHDPTQCTSPVPILWLVTPKPAATKLPFSIGLLHLGRAAPHEKADFLLESLRALHKALNSPGEASASAGPPGVFTHVLPSGALSPALDTGIDAALDEVSNTLAQHFGRDEGKNGDRNLRDLRFALKVDASHLRKKIRQAPQTPGDPILYAWGDDTPAKTGFETALFFESMHEKESRAIRLGYIQDAWDADDPTGWQLAVKYLYGKHKIVIARSWQPQQQQPQEQEPHPEPCCTAVSLSLPAVGTVSSLLRAAKAASGACGTPVVIEDQPLLCYGGGGSLFSASPCPVSAWNDFSAFGKVLANAGRLSNVNPLPEDLPLPDVEVPAVATTEAVSKAGAKAGKKK